MGDVVKISKDSEKNPYLPFGGTYGPGMEHEASVEVFQYEPVCEPGKGPAFDKDCTSERAPWCLFVFRVKFGESLCFARSYQPLAANSNSKALKFLQALGVEMSETPDGDMVFDTTGIVGRKCGIEVKAPRTGNDGSKYTGDVVNVIGV